jgi:hypothetical protein
MSFWTFADCFENSMRSSGETVAVVAAGVGLAPAAAAVEGAALGLGDGEEEEDLLSGNGSGGSEDSSIGGVCFFVGAAAAAEVFFVFERPDFFVVFATNGAQTAQTSSVQTSHRKAVLLTTFMSRAKMTKIKPLSWVVVKLERNGGRRSRDAIFVVLFFSKGVVEAPPAKLQAPPFPANSCILC